MFIGSNRPDTFDGRWELFGFEYHGRKGGDTVYGSINSDVLFGERGEDYLAGNDGDDYLDGSFGNDTVEGGYGNDTIIGGRGSDLLLGDEGSDAIYGGYGNDRIIGTNYSTHPWDIYDTLTGGPGNDEISSYYGHATAYGGAGRDTIFLGGDWSVATGDEGNDSIVIKYGTADGGSGSDVIQKVNGFFVATVVYAVGGLDADRFIMNENNGNTVPGNNFCIVDFQSGVDKIEFNAYIPGLGWSNQHVLDLDKDGDHFLTANDGFDGANGVLQLDSGLAVLLQGDAIQIYGHSTVATTDFIV